MSDQTPLTPQEKMQAFERARKLVEPVNEILAGADHNDVLLALQLLCAKYAAQTEIDLRVLLSVFAQNLPQMVTMWEKASVDVEASEQNPFAASPLGRPPGGSGRGTG